MAACPECDFRLYRPITSLRVSRVGLYSDARFPGRVIVALRNHYDNLLDIPGKEYRKFTKDIRDAMMAVEAVTGSTRVNLAILGNAEPHVHAHLIPRDPDTEMHPAKSPWNDPRPLTVLSQEDEDMYINDIAMSLSDI